MKLTIVVGGRFHAFDLAYQLQKRNINYKLITSYPLFILKRFSLISKYAETIFVKEILKRFFDKFRFISRNFDYDYWLSSYFSKKASYLINYSKTDILVGWSGFSYHSFKKAQQFNCVKILERGSTHILHQVNILKEEYKKLKLEATLPSKKTIATEIKEYELADYICVPSEFVKKSFIDRGFNKNKIIKIPYGVDIKNFKPETKKISKEKKIFTIISTGSVSVRKGSIYILKAFIELNIPNSELIFVGTIDDEVKKIIAKFAVKKNIKFFKKQPQSKLSAIYNKADIFVLFSLEEGLSMVQIQAMACGLPVICTHNTGGSEIVDHGVNGFILPIRDINLLKKKILVLYKNRSLLKKMKHNSFIKAQRLFSWELYGDKNIKFYKKILNKKNNPK
jgi:glycosyltransferase involved in cell wall biosynthesis